jgi:hypothetical protein
MVKRAVVGGADRVTRKARQRIPYPRVRAFTHLAGENAHYSPQVYEPLDPPLVGDKEEIRRAAREQPLAFLKETKDRDLEFLPMPACIPWHAESIGMV